MARRILTDDMARSPDWHRWTGWARPDSTRETTAKESSPIVNPFIAFVNRMLAAVTMAGTALLAIALAAPWIGLGRGEDFLLYAQFGLPRGEVAYWGGATIAGAFGARVLIWLLGAFHRVAPWVQSALIAVLTVFVSSLAAEAFLRTTLPFAVSYWPSRFDPAVGFLFEPGAELRWTNGVDFWQSTVVNEDGMLDRPMPGPKAARACRILFVGDSFVEAAQVPIADKVQVTIEKMARARGGLPPIEAAGVGFSGTGQASQLALYEKIGRKFAPDIVVLVVVSNDFTDNSAILSGLLNGWDPRRPPREFFVPGDGPGGFVRQKINPAWREAGMPTGVVPEGSIDAALARLSYLYVFVRGHLRAQFPSLFPNRSAEAIAARVAWARGFDLYAKAEQGWNLAEYPGADAMFKKPGPLPPVFDEALAATRAAFAEFKRLGEADNFQLLALGSHSLYPPSPFVDRLQAILGDLDIPYADQTDHIRKAGGTPMEAQFSRDGHWNAQGHRWAAEAVLDRMTPQCSVRR
jgi:hypothetical protein